MCTRTSSSASSCTTRPRTAPCSELSSHTLSSHWVRWLLLLLQSVAMATGTDLQRCPVPFTGERLTDAEVDEVLKDCLDPEDDEGMIPYVREY